MLKLIRWLKLALFIFLFIGIGPIIAESSEETLKRLKENKELIISAAKIFDVNPLYLASIIYTERTLNFDWTDEVFDEVIAKIGQNSSLGFCQVKLKTAYFIERQLSTSNSIYYCGKNYSKILTISKNPFELIKKLENDTLNIQYAAAYLRIIQNYWANKGYSINNKPEIIGTLYQMGLFKRDGSTRIPHFNPQANEFGNVVNDSLEIVSTVFGGRKKSVFGF